MLDITLYGEEDQEEKTIDLPEDFFKWLAESDFTEIGKRRKKEIKVDGEDEEKNVVDLEKGTISNRQKLKDFFEKEIVKESGKMLSELGESPSKKEYQDLSFRLRKLHEILGCVSDERYKYLERRT